MPQYALAIGLGAFLLFLVQPLIGRFILPWFGGGPGVWTTCLLFFQVSLFVGYAYAHGVVRWLSPRRQMWTHLALLVAALALLPIIPGDTWKPPDAGQPALRIFALLAACIGLPYIALAATGPLLQAWSTRTHPGRSPYRLYALSNAASTLALLSYPFAIEPAFSRRAQAWFWSCGFAVFAAVCGYCALRAGRAAPRDVPANTVVRQKLPMPKARKSHVTSAPVAVRGPATSFDRLLWLLLPACGSILLLAVTSKLSQDIAPIPIFWIATLALYLATFIICFEWPRLYLRHIVVPVYLVSVGLVIVMMRQAFAPIVWQASAYLLMLFAGCLLCHGELHRRRPAPERLTTFYLMMALGGAVGAAFVSLVAPVLFSDNDELYVGIFGAITLFMLSMFNDSSSTWYRGARRAGWIVLTTVVLACALAMTLTVRYLEADTVLWTRNFYGALRVAQRTPDSRAGRYRTLEHGIVSHGAQLVDARFARWPTMYYGFRTGVGLVMRLYPKEHGRRVGAVGLGIGTMAAYGLPGDVYRFYELDPQVERIARTEFTYLADSAATVEVVLGDARLSLEREAPQRFDVIVLDAFNGDAIPVHLLTREAFAIYERHLVAGGVIAVHVSNRYLELHPVVHRLAAALGFSTMFVDTPAAPQELVTESQWVLMTRDRQLLNRPELQQVGFMPRGLPDVALWTDDHSSLLEVLRWAPRATR